MGGKALCFYLFYARWVWENKRVKTMCLTRGKQGLSVGWKTPLQGEARTGRAQRTQRSVPILGFGLDFA
ncbi:hypothetical protein DI487_10195 [Flavobacterium sediminis]|uniref:Uncharacterized protein n=1 Tax=Flavobacterium sediminis TaxID=2201181 RepID=A0A2U8QVF0_9FLAO|nr:hypothetical protein DI487_10195 [Flavobacterium sediminis]